MCGKVHRNRRQINPNMCDRSDGCPCFIFYFQATLSQLLQSFDATVLGLTQGIPFPAENLMINQ